MRHILPIFAFASLAACNPFATVYDADFDGPIEDRARFVADKAQWALPRERAGVTIVAMRAEGREVILDAETSLAGMGSVTPGALTKQWRPFICEDGYRNFIEHGGVIRFDVRDPHTGKRLPPGRVASCHGN